MIENWELKACGKSDFVGVAPETMPFIKASVIVEGETFVLLWKEGSFQKIENPKVAEKLLSVLEGELNDPNGNPIPKHSAYGAWEALKKAFPLDLVASFHNMLHPSLLWKRVHGLPDLWEKNPDLHLVLNAVSVRESGD